MSQIISKEVQEYIEVTKLVSLRKLYELLELQPTPMQEKIAELFDDKLEEWNFLTLAASRRSGKSFTTAIICVLELMKPHSSTILISRSAKSLSVNFNSIIKIVKQLGLPITKLNSQTYYLEVNGVSHFRASMYKTIEGLIGNKASLIVGDEVGLYQFKESFSHMLLPMRMDYTSYPNGNFVAKVVLVSSPREIGSDFEWFYKQGLPPVKDKHKYERNDGTVFDTYVSLMYNIYDSPLVGADLVASIKKETESEPDVWLTEYLCQFITVASEMAFKHFTEHNLYDLPSLLKKITNDGKQHVTVDLYLGVDVGFVDASAIVPLMEIENKLYVLPPIIQSGMTTDVLGEHILSIVNNPLDTDMVDIPEHIKDAITFNHEVTYFDPAALITRMDLASGPLEIESLPAYNRISQGLEICNTLFENGQLFIPYCASELQEHIKTLAFKESYVSMKADFTGDPFIRVKGAKHHNDGAASLRYVVASLKRYMEIPLTVENEIDMM